MMRKEIPYAKAIYGEPEKQAVNRVLDSGWLSGGEETIKFEKELAEWWGVKHALSVNSGSSANFVALQALGLPEGSEIITPAGAAFPTTISPMVYLKHRPAFIDIDLRNLCLGLDEVEKAIRPETKAIVFAHTLGFMPNMKRLMYIARRHDLRVIEDCADAVGSKQDGKKAGTFGDIATTSFYPAHHLTTGGEGGAILTNNTKLYWEAHKIRDWGRDCVCQHGKEQPACRDRFGKPPFDHRYYYTGIGLNFKLTEMQAAFGREQLKRLDGFIDKRRENYATLAGRLGDTANPELSPFAYPLLHENKDVTMEKLGLVGIHTRALFSGNILAHPAYKDINHRVVGELPNSDRLLREAFFVGVGPHLDSDDMNYIADNLREVL